MQVIPVSNYSYGCRFFHRKQKTTTPPAVINNTENDNNRLLSKNEFKEMIDVTLDNLKAKHDEKKVDTDYEIYTRFTNLEQRPTVAGVNDFKDFVKSDFTGRLTDLMNQKVREWRNDKDICRRSDAIGLSFIKDDARSILKYELDRDLTDRSLDRNYKIKQDLFRNDRELFLKLINDNVVIDYATAHNDKFANIVQFYKDNPNTKVTEEMIQSIAWG